MSHCLASGEEVCEARSLELANGLSVLLVADADAELAAAAVSVGAGSAHEPTDLAGLAHLLEHMLFLGSDRYPAEDDFATYVQGHGGRYNATTQIDQTRYFFEIPPGQLDGALDRLARFFVAPRLDAAAIARERKVIDAEYHARREDEEQGVLGVIKQVLDPQHPASRFFAGNRDTLAGDPEALRQALVAFHHRYYGAANLRLAVVANLPVDTLEQLVRHRFADVPGRPACTPPVWPALLPPARLPLRLALERREGHELRLCFPVPAPAEDEAPAAWEVLSRLLTYRGAGGLYAWLRERGWLNDIDASMLLDTAPQGLYQIRFGLTVDGGYHAQAVAAALFAYLRRIGIEGIAEWRYREQRLMEQRRFRRAAMASSLEFAKALADRLHRYPLEEALLGPYRKETITPLALTSCLTHLAPHNSLTLFAAPSVRGDRVSPWFPMRYRLDAPGSGLVEAQHEATAFTLPPPNSFLAAGPETEPELGETAKVEESGKGDSEDAEFESLRQTKRWRVGFRPHAPSMGDAAVWLSLAMPRAPDLTDSVHAELLLAWLEEEMSGELQQAREAGLTLAMNRHARGIMLRLEGSPQPLERLLSRSLERLAGAGIEPPRFEQAREALRARWARQREAPAFRRLLQLPEAYLGHGSSEETLLAELALASSARLEALRAELLQAAGIDCLLAGPLGRARARRIDAALAACFPGESSCTVVSPAAPITFLQAGREYRQRLLASQPDSAVALYVPAADASPRQQACHRLLALLLHDRLYQRLRVERQLGYVVLARYHPLHERPGLILLVQSPSLSVPALRRELREFVDAFGADTQGLSAEDFARYREGLLQSLTCAQRDPAAQRACWWARLTRSELAEQEPQRVVEAIATLSFDEIHRFYRVELLPAARVWLHN
ncbi:insulinase family protein [Billgrantia saliphila]|uniref:insulinase family protein n=1 Tax=Billgrantia saliphila TaxID=1848458 RepID=UPI000CE3B7DA|nr:insulinase family protein [Halomonas saliphila]